MKHLFFGLSLAAASLCLAAPGGELPPIALYTQFSGTPPAAVMQSLQAEVRAIMAPAGLTFDWFDLRTADGKHAVVQLAIIHFEGRCDVSGLMPRDSNPGALGWTNTSDGVILPFATVDCSAVRSFIQKEMLELPAGQRAISFGRALGRVAAHELYHIFANTAHHGNEGVAREAYDVHDLLCRDFQFEPKEFLALIRSQAHADLESAAAPITEDPDRHN